MSADFVLTSICERLFRAAKRLVVFLSVLFSVVLLATGLDACTTVKPYERVYLNDSEMSAGTPSVATFDEYVHTNREGSSGGALGKGSGGCGCN